MKTINLNNFENIFKSNYPYKIELLGVIVRNITPITKKKYNSKVVKHLYIKTHGKVFDLTETTEIGAENRCRINLTPITVAKIPHEKEATQYAIKTKFYAPMNNIIKFAEFKSIAIDKSTCDAFEIFFKDAMDTGIVLILENFVSVDSNFIEEKIKAAVK